MLQRPGPGNQTSATARKGTVLVQTVYKISGQVTLARTNNQPLAGVSIGVTDSNGTQYCYPLKTDSNGQYSCALAAGGTYTVTPSAPFTYWFTPKKSNPFANLGANQTQNFTGTYLLTVYLLHGIGQDHNGVAALGLNLLDPTMGLDATRFIVNSNFDFRECAANPSCTNSQYGDACSVGAGGKSLAHYIQQNPPPGDMIFVGYSMGGLIARDLITNNYFNVINAQHRVAGLITLGTPHLGYPWSSVDDSAFCPQLVDDMQGSWLPPQPSPVLSTYLSSLTNQWQSAAYFGATGWLRPAKAATIQCARPPRRLNAAA